MISQLRIGPLDSIEDVKRALHDVEIFLNQVFLQGAFTEDAIPAAGQFHFLIREDTGEYHLWRLLAGAGVTLTPDAGARTLTVLSP